jgi:hypothetical protein
MLSGMGWDWEGVVRCHCGCGREKGAGGRGGGKGCFNTHIVLFVSHAPKCKTPAGGLVTLRTEQLRLTLLLPRALTHFTWQPQAPHVLVPRTKSRFGRPVPALLPRVHED